MMRGLARKARDTQDWAERGKITETLIHRLDLLEKKVLHAAEERGRLGGRKTAERGPEYFKQIAAMRKTRGGGRPRKPESAPAQT